ncbi:MAG: TIGR00341 family protein [Pseudomonadota bacterium]
MIVLSAPDQVTKSICKEAQELGASGIRTYAERQAEDRTTVTMIAGPETRQAVVDAIQAKLSSRNDWRMTILPVETTIPLPQDEEEERQRIEKASQNKIGGMTREEVWNQVWEQAKFGQTYVVFVILSTIVAALGMLTDNVAVVVGAMVIAPLLGPNLAFSVGVALGDRRLIGHALLTNFIGLVTALSLSVVIGLLWRGDLSADELTSRADVDFTGLAIALASGAAAALSLVAGLSSALVGVMVAVALLPPTSAVGIFLGTGQLAMAGSAAMLLAVNIVSVNLAAQSILFWRGIRPRTFFEDKKARRGRVLSAVLWIILTLLLVGLMWWRTRG